MAGDKRVAAATIGSILSVEYPEGAGEFMSRLLLRKTIPAVVARVMEVEIVKGVPAWWVLTPTGDVYPEQLGLKVLTSIAELKEDGKVNMATVPSGRKCRLDFGFGVSAKVPSLTPLVAMQAMEAAEMGDLEALEAEKKDSEKGGGGALAVTAGKGFLPPSAREFAVIGPLVPEIDVKEKCKAWAKVGDFVLALQGGHTFVLAAASAAVDWAKDAAAAKKGEKGKLKKKGGKVDKDDDSNSEKDDPGIEREVDDLDARVLSVERDPSGERWRNFKDTVSELTVHQWSGFPVQGPRTALWCLRFIMQHSIHPTAHHTRWLQMTGVLNNDSGAQEHEMAMRVLEYAVCYDQLQAAELAAIELVARRAQLIELKYRDKVIGGGMGGTVDEDSFLYMGTGRTRGLLMISPALEEYVAGELSKETSDAKERRKLREERGAAKAQPLKK